MKYAFIREQSREHRIVTLCRMLGVTRSGYYAWIKRPVSKRARDDLRLVRRIRRFHDESDRTYGSPRVHADLREAGESCGVNRVARLMRKHGISARPARRRHRYVSGKPASVAPNHLKREFDTAAPDQAWVTDITYIRTWEGWLYLAVVLDLYSRRVIGWSMQRRMDRTLALNALLMSVRRRRPKGRVLVHSDQGSQYGSDDWIRFCRSHRLRPSMSRRGNCWDNAVAEAFFGSLKRERIRRRVYATRDAARADVFDYIEMFYNSRRRHSYLGGVSPEAFEASNPAPGVST